jgi:hypothetical protein
MTTTYRVEVSDGSDWTFGIRYDENKRIPVFCGVESADQLGSHDEAERLRQDAIRICGGTTRVAAVHD